MANARDLGASLAGLVGEGRVSVKVLPVPRPAPGVRALAGKKSLGRAAGQMEETDYSQRTHYPDIAITSADGLFEWRVAPIRKIALIDPAGNPLNLVLAAPT
ncbi:MAG: hypothetical protein Q8O33_04435 [Pseudomonadota bacterium]|nr:hypothetical protein [Pseudomonadota bacterium]